MKVIAFTLFLFISSNVHGEVKGLNETALNKGFENIGIGLSYYHDQRNETAVKYIEIAKPFIQKCFAPKTIITSQFYKSPWRDCIILTDYSNDARVSFRFKIVKEADAIDFENKTIEAEKLQIKLEIISVKGRTFDVNETFRNNDNSVDFIVYCRIISVSVEKYCDKVTNAEIVEQGELKE